MIIGLKEYQSTGGDSLHLAYLRLRTMIPGAFNTPDAPTPEQVWETTEAALKQYIAAHDEITKRYYDLVANLRQLSEDS